MVLSRHKVSEVNLSQLPFKFPTHRESYRSLSRLPTPLRGGGPDKGGGVESEFDFPPVLYVDLPLYGMTYPLAVQVVQRQ